MNAVPSVTNPRSVPAKAELVAAGTTVDDHELALARESHTKPDSWLPALAGRLRPALNFRLTAEATIL
jgi:hypothetical protein